MAKIKNDENLYGGLNLFDFVSNSVDEKIRGVTKHNGISIGMFRSNQKRKTK